MQLKRTPLVRTKIQAAVIIVTATFLSSACASSINNYYPQPLQKLSQSYASEHSSNLTLDKNIVRLVDVNASTGNLLFRGNSPVSNDVFEYDLLKTYLADAASPRSLPDNFIMIDVSLLNDIDPTDRRTLKVERDYWNGNKDKGLFVHHTILGSFTSPDDYPASVRKTLEDLPTIDRLDELIVQLHTLMLQKSPGNRSSLIYVHCEAGRDRTGEVIAAYSMKYQGVSYRAAIKNAREVAGRDISRFSENAVKWYAWYLTDYEKIPTIGPID